MDVNSSIISVYGSLLYPWVSSDARRDEIAAAMNSFPRIRDNVVPLTTFLLFAKKELGLTLSIQFTAVFSEKIKNSFLEHLLTLEDQSRVQVALDDGNFKAEVAAFGNMEEAITHPHLDVSPLYRYMAALQQSLLVCVDDKLISDAVSWLRYNPYLYFAYGDAYVPLMPVAWEGI